MQAEALVQYRGQVTGRKEKEHSKATYLHMCGRTLPVTVWTTAHFQMMSSTMKSHWNRGPKNICMLHYC